MQGEPLHRTTFTNDRMTPWINVRDHVGRSRKLSVVQLGFRALLESIDTLSSVMERSATAEGWISLVKHVVIQ